VITPVSRAQHAAAMERRTPPVELVREGVWTVPMPLPEWAGMESTLTTAYVGDDGRVGLVDPGWDTEDNRRRLGRWLSQRGLRLDDVHIVVSTHLHKDHLGLASWLHEESGAPIVLHATELAALVGSRPGTPDVVLFERWGVPPEHRDSLGSTPRSTFPKIPADSARPVEDGDLIDVAGTSLRVISTPGHTGGSICLVDARNGLIHTGDHVLPVVRPGLALGGDDHRDPINDYLRSLSRLEPYDELEVLPGHEFRFTGLRDRRRALAAHHLTRNAQVGMLLDSLPREGFGAPTIWRIAERLSWTGGWGAVQGFLRRSALSQTAFHVRFLGREAELEPSG
jgi:glyoxylase-like metal-dependent hydrolase (beta-lactamase superfamily II)